jgi:hypothetical protein
MRGRADVPLAAIREAATVSPLSAVRGIRAHGITVLGLLQVGRWGVGAGVRQLVAVRRGRPAVRLVVDPAAGFGFDELVVSLRDADGIVRAVTRGRQAHR